jgi:hypothetical protein
MLSGYFCGDRRWNCDRIAASLPRMDRAARVSPQPDENLQGYEQMIMLEFIWVAIMSCAFLFVLFGVIGAFMIAVTWVAVNVFEPLMKKATKRF